MTTQPEPLTDEQVAYNTQHDSRREYAVNLSHVVSLAREVKASRPIVAEARRMKAVNDAAVRLADYEVDVWSIGSRPPIRVPNPTEWSTLMSAYFAARAALSTPESDEAERLVYDWECGRKDAQYAGYSLIEREKLVERIRAALERKVNP